MPLCELDRCHVISKIKNQFLCGLDTKLLCFNEFFNHFEQLEILERQGHLNILLRNTINNPLVQERPLKVSYRKLFLKCLLNYLENLDCDFAPVYEAYVEILQSPDTNEYHYRHYSFENKILSVRETINVISEGTTGLSVWQGGIALADWCLNNKNVLCDQNILELGCGVGLTGLVVCLSECNPSSYCFSDCHPNVLQSISHNMEVNSVKHRSRVDISLLPLDWRDFEEAKLKYQPTLILGADIVYDPESFESLYRTLHFYLSKNLNTTAVIACTIRDDSTFNRFKDGLIKNDLCVNGLTKGASRNFYFSEEPPVIILKIKSFAKTYLQGLDFSPKTV